MGEVSRVLGDRYEIGELLGRGGMAEVHAGLDQRLGRSVAIKRLRPELADDPVLRARFRREARSVAGLNHPAVVAVYDTGEDVRTEPGGAQVRTPFMVMELVAGRTVRDLLDDAGGDGLGTRRAVEVAAGVLTALQAAHDAGIVHRDVKPANVMVTPDGGVKVMDFGIARSVVDSSATVTQTDSVMGTALYLSPEQARGEVVDARTDQYSCACLLYEALTGRPPFLGDYPVAVAYQHVSAAPQPPSTFNGAVDAGLDRVVLRALAKDRDDRYDDAQQFRDHLLSALAGRAVLAPSAVPPAPRRGKRVLVALAATLLLAVVSLSGWLPQREVQASGVAASPQQGSDGTSSTAPSAVPSAARSTDTASAGAVALGAPVVLPVSSGPSSAGPDVDGGTQATGGATAVSGQVALADYAGRSVGAATEALQALGLVAAPVTEASDRPAGQVLRQDPAAGTSLDAGSVVTLVVSVGSPPPSGGASTSTAVRTSTPAPAPSTTPGDDGSTPGDDGAASGSAPADSTGGGAPQPPSAGTGQASGPGAGQGAGRGQGQGAGQGRAVGAGHEDAQQGRGGGPAQGRGSEKKG